MLLVRSVVAALIAVSVAMSPAIGETPGGNDTTADKSFCHLSAFLMLASRRKDLTKLPREKSDPVSNDNQPSLNEKRSTRS